MKYQTYIQKGSMAVLALSVVGLLFAFTQRTAVNTPEGTPLFITGIAPYKSGIIVSQKGVSKVSVYASDYKEILQEWEMDEIPTGVAVNGGTIVATVSGEKKNGVCFLSATRPEEQVYVPTGSGASAP